MAFKMKGFSMHQGTSPAKAFVSAAQRKAVWASKNEQSPNKQKKTKEDLIKEGFTPADADKMIKDGATTGRTELAKAKVVKKGKGETADPKATSETMGGARTTKKSTTKKSTVSAHGQLNDAELEYQEDLKRSKETPNKQKEVGGTESKKGNIFTRRGRTQRSINKVEKTKNKLKDNANKEGFDTKKSKKLIKKVIKKTVKRDKKITKYLTKDAPLKHAPWDKAHKQKAAHPNTAEAHNASPTKKKGFHKMPDGTMMADSAMKQKKTKGFGPRAAKGDDDQSKELARSRYEMGMYKNDPTGQAKPKQSDFTPAYEGADYSKDEIRRMSESEKIAKIDGYTPKKSKKVMKDGSKTQTHQKGKGAVDFTPHQFRKK
tara:strand:+ start:857 stop:1978 length:1122 start_codon:yes stop_codon:yes gene_type:complete